MFLSGTASDGRGLFGRSRRHLQFLDRAGCHGRSGRWSILGRSLRRITQVNGGGRRWHIIVAFEEATLQLDDVFAEGEIFLLNGFVIANQRLILLDLFLQRGNVCLFPLSECALWQLR